MGRIGIANRIVVTTYEMADTLECFPTYSDCVILFAKNNHECDSLAQSWLSTIGGDQ
jgi:hypothetical protein